MVRSGRPVGILLLVVVTVIATPTAAAEDWSVPRLDHGYDTTSPQSPDVRPTPSPAENSTETTPVVNRTNESTVLIRIGDADARMRIEVDLSLFADLPAPGRLGFASAGLLAGERVVGVELGVRFLGVGDPLTFVGNPFSRFTVEARTDLSLPFLPEPTAAGGAPQ